MRKFAQFLNIEYMEDDEVFEMPTSSEPIGAHFGPHSEESRKLISEMTRKGMAKAKEIEPEKWSNLRKEMWKNPEYREKTLKARIGMKKSAETKLKMSLAKKGKIPKNIQILLDYNKAMKKDK